MYMNGMSGIEGKIMGKIKCKKRGGSRESWACTGSGGRVWCTFAAGGLLRRVLIVLCYALSGMGPL